MTIPTFKPLILKPVDQIDAARMRLLAVYQRSGRLSEQNRAVLQGSLECLAWVLGQEVPENLLAKILRGDRLDDKVVKTIVSAKSLNAGG